MHTVHKTPIDEIKDSVSLAPEVLQKFPAMSGFQKRIGNTPLIRVETPDTHGNIFAKCEFFNHGETVKARVAFAMLWRLLSETPPELVRDLTVLEYSGGTLATCLAELCYYLRIRLVLVLSEVTSPALLSELRERGVEVHLTEKELGFHGVMERARELAKKHPDWKFLYQHVNEVNQLIHFRGTGAEIVRQLKGHRPDAWVASIGTGGTLIGVYSRLAKKFPQVRMFATTPAEMPYGTDAPPNSRKKFAGSGGLGYGNRQPFVIPFEAQIERHLTYEYEATTEVMRKFYLDTGTRIGSSSAANLMASMEIAHELGPNSNVVTVFPCAGFEEEWQRLLD